MHADRSVGVLVPFTLSGGDAVAGVEARAAGRFVRRPAPRPTRGCSGQAAVETALTLPLALFLVLGTLQLFLALQARLAAHYAAARATRAGAVSFGSCAPMNDAALLALLPTFTRTDDGDRLVAAYTNRKTLRFSPGMDGGRDEEIFWLRRERPQAGELGPLTADADFDEEEYFDLPAPEFPERRLEVRMIFWFPLRVPFANWVFSRMALAHFGVEAYRAASPLAPVVRDAKWLAEPSSTLDSAVATELRARAAKGHFVLPVETTFTMQMMTPARAGNFARPSCVGP